MWHLEVWVDGRDEPLKKYEDISGGRLTELLRKVENLSQRNRRLYCIYWYKETPLC